MKLCRVSVIGASGRLGFEIIQQVAENKNFELIDAVVSPSSSKVGLGVPGFEEKKFVSQCDGEADIIIDASLPERLSTTLKEARKLKAALLVLSTGHQDSEVDAISLDIPFCFAPNTSFGIHLLSQAVRLLAREGKEQFSFHLLDTHHSKKRDAPSGTAKSIARAAKQEGVDVEIQSIRGGTVPGEHELRLLGAFEEISVTHKAQSRALFAVGALHLASKLVLQPPRRYTSYELFSAH